MKKLVSAIIRNPMTFLGSIFSFFSGAWVLIEIIRFIFADSINHTWMLLLIPSVISLVGSIYKIYPRESVAVPIKNTNTTVQIKFGDMFNEEGMIAIPVNEFFDSEIGDLVSERSLHGTFIKNILGGRASLFNESVELGTKDSSPAFVNRTRGNKYKYPIGTTVVCEFGGKEYLLFVLSKTNEKNEAYTSPSLICESLSYLLTKARSECGGKTLNVPLIGTGLSRSGIPPLHIIDLILIVILDQTKRGEVTKQVNIIIHESLREEIDLNQIKKKWS